MKSNFARAVESPDAQESSVAADVAVRRLVLAKNSVADTYVTVAGASRTKGKKTVPLFSLCLVHTILQISAQLVKELKLIGDFNCPIAGVIYNNHLARSSLNPLYLSDL